jgi:type I restriction enzyme, S subunit
MQNWTSKKLGELVKFVGGGTPKRDHSEYWNGEIPWASVKDIKSESLYETAESITKKGLDNSASNLIPAESVIIASRVGLGKVSINKIPVAINQDLKALKPKQDNLLLPRYLLFFLLSKARYLENMGVGATVKGLKISDYEKMDFPLPPLREQQRIVKILDEVDVLRKLRANAECRTADLIPSLFNKIFLKTNYIEKTIGEYLEEGWLLLHKDGNHGGLYPRVKDFGDEGVAFLSASSVTNKGSFNQSNVKRLSEEKARKLRHGWIQKDDVLLAHNATVGKVGYYEGLYENALIGTSLTAFRVNRDCIEPRFLWAALRNEYFQQQLKKNMKQAVRDQVPITAQRKLLLRIPNIELQKDFTKKILEIFQLEAKQTTSRNYLDDLFQSCLHRAFNGEL